MDVLSFAQVADVLGVPATRVHQLVRDGCLVAITTPEAGRCVPALFLQDGAIVKSLRSVITQLRDADYEDHEIVEWLFRDDDTLPGAPIDALRANHGSEVRRRAQVAGY